MRCTYTHYAEHNRYIHLHICTFAYLHIRASKRVAFLLIWGKIDNFAEIVGGSRHENDDLAGIYH